MLLQDQLFRNPKQQQQQQKFKPKADTVDLLIKMTYNSDSKKPPRTKLRGHALSAMGTSVNGELASLKTKREKQVLFWGVLLSICLLWNRH